LARSPRCPLLPSRREERRARSTKSVRGRARPSPAGGSTGETQNSTPRESDLQRPRRWLSCSTSLDRLLLRSDPPPHPLLGSRVRLAYFAKRLSPLHFTQ